MNEEKFNRLAEIDTMVERMRSSSSVGEPPDGDLLAMMEVATKALGPRPQSEFRANSKTIALIGKEIANRTPASRLPKIPLDGPPRIGSPEHFGMYGITIEVDESVPDGWVKPALPKPSFDFTSMRLKIDPTP